MTASAEADQVSRPLLPLPDAALLPHVFAEHPEVVGVEVPAPGAGEAPHVRGPGHEVTAAHLVLQLGPVYPEPEQVEDHPLDVQVAGVGGEGHLEHAVPVLTQVLDTSLRGVRVVRAADWAFLVTNNDVRLLGGSGLEILPTTSPLTRSHDDGGPGARSQIIFRHPGTGAQ